MPDALPDLDFAKTVRCHHCTEDIFANANLAVKCEVCSGLVLCMSCFALDLDLGSHQADHSYSLFDNGQFAMTDVSSWNVRDLLQLVNNVESAGLDNWPEVRKALPRASGLSDLNADEVRQNFFDIFVDGLLGNHVRPRYPRPEVADHSGSDSHAPVFSPASINLSGLSDRDIFNVGLLAERREFDANPLDFEDEFIVADVDFISHTTDFKSTSSKELVVNSTEAPTKIDTVLQELNVVLVQFYRNRLRKRQMRNSKIFNFDLLSKYFRQPTTLNVRLRPHVTSTQSPASSPCHVGAVKSGPADEPRPSCLSTVHPVPSSLPDAVNRIKFVASVLEPDQFDDFSDQIAEEGRLRARIKELNLFRRNGITRLSDSVMFKVGKNERRLRKKTKALMVAHAGADEQGRELQQHQLGGQQQQQKQPSYRDEAVDDADSPLLSHDELAICQSFKMSASQYISLKTQMLLSNSSRSDGSSASQSPASSAILGYMSRAGWITAGGSY